MEKPCILCCSKEEDELIFGKVHKQDQVVVHRNCLYLSSNLVQNGNERHGILSFLKKDILMEKTRCTQLRCFYCQRLGANIGCCRSKCRRSFHTKCGKDNLAINQFSGSYNSYCHQHVPKYRFRPGPAEQCMICFEALVPKGKRFSLATAVQSPCCRNGWYHQPCLQMYANSAGYFFKCPLCKDEDKFGEVAFFGISIPNCDASWELEPNAFEDQLQRAQNCTASKCRLRPTTTNRDLLYCIMCGSNPVHTVCTAERATTYRCADCTGVTSLVAPESADSDEEDVFDRIAEMIVFQPRDRNASTLNDTRDLRHSKLVASMRVSSESDDDDDDDDEIFNKVADLQNQSRQERAKPTQEAASSSGSGSSSRTPMARRSRRTLPAQMPDQNENKPVRARKRRGSESPIVERENRRLLQPISPGTTAARSNVGAIVGRRRTMATSHPRLAHTKRLNLDESCVANRTRTRLPTYMAVHKHTP